MNDVSVILKVLTFTAVVAEKEAQFLQPLLRLALASRTIYSSSGTAVLERLVQERVTLITPLQATVPAAMVSAVDTGESIVSGRDASDGPIVWWRYRIPLHDLLKAVVRFFRASRSSAKTEGISVHLFGRDATTSVSDVSQLLDSSGLDLLLSAEYVRITRGGWTVLFDIVPFPSAVPLEVAVIASNDLRPYSRQSCELLAAFHRDSAVVSLQPHLMTDVLAELLNRGIASILQGLASWNETD